MINPRYIEDIRFSPHAQSKIKQNFPDLTIDLIYGRVLGLHGLLYLDTKKGEFELYLEDKEVSVVFHTYINDRYTGIAEVHTVFDLDSRSNRFNKTKYEVYMGRLQNGGIPVDLDKKQQEEREEIGVEH